MTCLPGSALPDAERRQGGARNASRHTPLRAARSPVWFNILNTLPAITHPNCVLTFATSAPPDRVADATPFILSRTHHPGTVFVLSVLVLSHARELHGHPTVAAALLPLCSSDAVTPEVRVIALSALLAVIPPDHALVGEINDAIDRTLSGSNAHTLHAALVTNFPSATPCRTTPGMLLWCSSRSC